MASDKPWEEFSQDSAQSGAAKPWEEFGGKTATTEGRGFLGHARDLGLSLAKSVVAVPEAAVGLADIPTGGAVGKALESQDGLIGFRPKEAKEFLSDFHTDQYKEQQRQFQDADGVIEKTGVALTNPSMIINTVAESAAPMLAGGAVARGITAVSKAAPVVAGALGEGSVMAGSQAESIRQQTEDGLLSAGQSLASLGTGLVGGLFGFAGGQLAKKLGIGDVDTMLASGVTPQHVAADLAQTPAKNLPRQVIEGAIAEGFLEELPQSVSEQIIQNLALNKPWHEGVEDAAVMGTLAGMAMGGAGAGYAGAVRGGAQEQPGQQVLEDQQSTAEPDATFETVPEPEQAAPVLAGLLPAPVYQAGADGEVRTSGDQNAVTQAQRQAEEDRLDRIRRGEVVDVTPIPQAPKLSEQLGLDPSAGPMSSAAALAVDSGATQQLHQQAALQEAAKAAEQGSNGAEQVNRETGEITQAQGDMLAGDPATELQTRLEFVRQQARAGGWDARLVAERDRLVAELEKLQPLPAAATDQVDVEQPTAPADLQVGIEQSQGQARATTAPNLNRTTNLQEEANAGEAPAEAQTEEQPAQAAPAPEAAPAEAAPAVDAGARWAGMSQAERQALAEQTDIKPVIRRNLPRAQWESMNPDVQQKLAGALRNTLTDEQAADFANRTGNTPENVRMLAEFALSQGQKDIPAYFEDQVKRRAENQAKAAAEKDELSRLSDSIVVRDGKVYQRTAISTEKRGREALPVRPTHNFPTQGTELWERYVGDVGSGSANTEIEKARAAGKPIDGEQQHAATAQQEASVQGEAAPDAPAASRPGLPSLVSVGPSGFEPTPIGGKLYREMSPQNLADELRMHNQGDVSSAFFTDNIDLALGQGDNRGVMVQYRGEAVSGSPHQKPGITERTGREYRADYVGADAIDQVLLPGGVRLGVLAKNMLARHFDRAELEEGRILYTRKGVDVGAPLHELLATGTQQQPVPAEQAPRGVLAEKAEAEATEFPLKAAAASYSGISHSGSDRAKSDAQEFQAYIDVARDAGLALAHTDAQKAAVEQAVGELRAEYLRQYGRLMNVRSSTYSGFVAGRSRLNARQADQRNSAYNRAIDTFVDWQKANEDRVRRAALDARTPEQVQADQQAVETARREKAERKEVKDRDLMRSILSWKRGGEPVEIARGALLAGVNKGRDGYPSSIKLQPADGATLVDDKFDLAQMFRERGMSVPESKRRVRELVDAVRAEDAAQALATPAAALQPEASPEPTASKTPRLDAHVALMKRVRSGEATADEYKAAFAHADGNQEALAAELGTMKKDELLRSGGYSFFHRYRNDNKADIVQALVNRIIDEYALGRRYGSSSFVMSAAGLAAHRQAQDLALRELVANTTEEDIKAHAAEVAAERKDLQDRREAQQKAIANPQTLAEFRQAVSYNMEAHGETRQQAFMRLTPEQRIRYDELEADSTKAQREQAKVQAKTQVASAGQTTASEVIETKHTKHGHDLFVIQLAERVDREDYDTLNISAKRLGGSYSSYRGNGAVPGFQFRTRDAAEAFRKLVVGDTADAQAIAEARRDAFEDDRSQSAVERLRAMAQALDERAQESLGRERKQNTDRRARMAASAEAAARADRALAATMSNLAQAIEDGRTKFLDTVRQKVQVEFLGRELRNAKDAQIRATSPSYADQEKRKGELVDAETVDYATFPTYTAMRSDLASLARQMVDVDGLKKLGARLEKVADDVTEAYTEWAKQNLLSVSRFTRGDQLADFKGREDAERAIRRSGLSGKAIVLPVKRGVNRIIMAPSEAMKQGLWQGDGDKRITLAGEFGRELVQALGRHSGSRINLPWALESAHEKRKRLEGMGILTGSEYRSALREFAALREAPAAPDKIKEMERAMIGRRNDGLDFFPTSAAVTEEAIDAADIQESMDVLEPSAGMGHMADAIREQTGVEPDVVELSGDRRELLEAKGYNLVGSDFMDVSGKQYDRIVMNPPFSKGRDIQHVQHAYSLLKPGGRLVAIMGEGAFFQSNSRAEGFRAWLDGLGATSERLPEGSFMDPALPVNTSVNARLVVIDKPLADEAGPSQPDEQPTVQYSFAGRNAQGADRLALDTARQRIAMGEDAEAVRQDTGWHRGADGRWRFEISDDQARIAVAGANAASIIANAEMRALDDGRTGATVGDVLDHQQLFAAYPSLRDLPLHLMPADSTALARLQRRPVGFAVQMQGSIPRDEMASPLIHELQHAIQNIEGFALGGSRRMFASDLDATGAETYRRLAGEVEARNVQMRMRMTPGLRQAIAPEATADVPSGEVLVTFNGTDLVGAPQPQNITGRPPMTAQGLVRAFDLQFPKLTKAVRTMLQRGQEGKRGGLVFIDSPDPLRIAGVFSRKTGTSLSASVQLFEDKGRIQGFYDAKSGLTFLVGPNLDPVTGPAVLLHEMTHGQQREKIDRQASNMLMNRASAKNADLRAFLDRVAARMVDAGETANPREAAAYIVEQAVIEGREQGFGEADSRFLGWVDQAIGKPVGDFLRSVLAMVRQWMLRHGMPIGQITVGDLVDYAMAGVEQAAAGNVRGEGLSLSQDDLQKARILQGPPVSVLRGDEAPRGMAAVREWATQLFKEQGGLANNPDLGAVVLDGRAVRDSLGHGKPNPYKYAAFAAVKEVLERGALVHQASYKGGESFYVSAPVVIDGMDDIVTVLVRREPSMQRMYLHSVATTSYLLSRRGSGADADAAEQRTGSSGSEDVASVLQRLLTATLDSDPGDGPQFSRSGLREIAGKATLELNRTFTAPGKLSWWHKTIGTMYNLAERSPFFKPVFESAQGFIDDVSHYAADAAEHAPKLLPKLETWRDIAKSPVSAADNKAVAKPVFEGTLMWARDVDGQPVRVESLAERAAKLTADQKAEILLATGKIPPGMLNAWRALSPEQFGKMVDSRYEAQVLKAGIVWTDAELRSIFKLTDQQVALYREFRAATDRSLDTMARADMLRFAGDDAKELREEVMDAPDVHTAARVLRDHLARRADDWPDRATHLLNLAHGVTERAERVAQLQAEGYAPLSRFGKYTVDVVDQDGERQYFSLFESKREANLMAEQMKVAFPGANISQGTLSEEAYKLFAGITPETLELFGNALGFDSQGDSAQDQAFQEYLRLTKTNRSAMRRLIHRKGIAGYSEDVGRVLASFVYSNARQTAAGLHLGDLAEAVDAIPQQQGELKDAAVRLAEYIRNPQEEAQAVRGLLFAQYLGGSVASAFVNMTQPVAVSFPWLSQYGGAGKAAAALGRAAKHMSTKGYQYETDLAKALKVAEDDGVVSPQEVHQLMAQARGSGSLRAGDGTRAGEARAMASNAVSRLSVAWGKLFGAAEQVNRRVTFIAAYRLAKEQGMPDPAAFARRAVTETQFVYSKASKMQWGRGAVGGTLMTFKTYSVAYLELMHRLWNQGEPGSQERKDGRKAAMLMIATLMLMSGVGGLPFGEDAEDLIDGAAQLMGYNFSAQKAKQQFLEEVFGLGLAGFIEKGFTGLPGMPLDVSGRLGMGNLIPGTGLLQERTDHTRDVLEIAGPAGDMASRFVSGGRKILGGDIGAGLLEMSPTAVRNAAKGVDMAATGMYRDTKGYKVLETSHLEAAMKAIGFQPASVAQVQEANWLNQRAKAFYSLRAQEIRAQWAAGIFERDQAKVAAARQQIADWNARNPDQPMIIRVPDIMRRVREMSKSKDQRIADTAPRAMRAAMREELARSRE